MTRLTLWFDELALWPDYGKLLNSPTVQRLLTIGMWLIAPIDYPAAAAMSHLLKSNKTK